MEHITYPSIQVVMEQGVVRSKFPYPLVTRPSRTTTAFTRCNARTTPKRKGKEKNEQSRA